VPTEPSSSNVITAPQVFQMSARRQVMQTHPHRIRFIDSIHVKPVRMDRHR
jgi:hypothetical protein